jgi:8-oxo-dGTP pyrophosphatase MutT (NUDIX family)
VKQTHPQPQVEEESLSPEPVQEQSDKAQPYHDQADTPGKLITEIDVPAAGGVIFRMRSGKPDVLLIYRRGCWDLPKGKMEDGESYAMAAAREVAEETGSSLPIIAGELPETRHTYREGNILFHKHTRWYAMISRASRFTPQTDEQIEKICWMPLKKAEKLVGYDNLRLVLAGLRDLLDTAGVKS